MYISATWKERNGNLFIGQIVDIPDFTSAADKLSLAYPDYELQSLVYINSPVEAADITGPAFLCQFTDKQTKVKTTIYIFQKNFEMAFNAFRSTYGYDPDTIAETKFTYRNETG